MEKIDGPNLTQVQYWWSKDWNDGTVWHIYMHICMEIELIRRCPRIYSQRWASEAVTLPLPSHPPPLNPSQILSSAPQLLPAFRVPLGGTAATNLTCALSFCLGPWGTLQQWNRTVDLIILKALSSPLGLGYPKDIILIIINWPRCLISVYVHHF